MILRRVMNDRLATIFCLILLALALGVVALNQWVPQSSPFHMPTYVVALLGKYLCYALLAVSIDLVWGYVSGKMLPISRKQR